VNRVTGADEIVAASTLTTAIVVPVARRARRRVRSRRAVWRWLMGSRGIEGITDPIPSAPEQFAKLKDDVAHLTYISEANQRTLTRLDRFLTGDDSPFRRRRRDDSLGEDDV
jgi:hypothetical protein